MKVLVNSTPIALWQDIIHEAETACAATLPQELEAYVVFLLIRYMDKPELSKRIVAHQLLEGLHASLKHRDAALLGVGDTCLLFSGLFPGIAEKRLVKVSYFVNMGRSAYDAVSKTSNDIYSLLAQQFVIIMDILQSIRDFAQNVPALMPIQAYDLWNEAGSRRALRILRQYTQASPVSRLSKDDTCIFKLK
jgi:hypothetical protein